MRRADYLQLRRGRWFVRLRVPAHLVGTVGQTHLVRSLDTNSEAVARERRWIALALLWDWIGAQTVSDGWEPAWAVGLTGAQRCPGEAAPSPQGSAKALSDHPSQNVNQPRRTAEVQSAKNTILNMMERWLREIEVRGGGMPA